jgi:HK97 gp10 family phage protein
MALQTGRMQMRGAREAAQVLKKLPLATRRKVLRAAARKAANVARNAVKQRAPVGPMPAQARKGKRATYGKLKDQIRTKRDRKSSSPDAEVYVVDTGKAYWGFFYERGQSTQKPRPFFVPAFEASIGNMTTAMRDELAKGVIREAKKLAGPIGSTLKRRR